MEEERQFNEALSARSRSVSSPGGSRPLSPYGPPLLPGAAGMPLSRPALHLNSQTWRPSDRFVKPAVPGLSPLSSRVAASEVTATAPAAASTPTPSIPQPSSPMDTSSKE
ncbi:hypothetical protein ACJJTC_001437 [Scirpophaga incertulas]